MLSKISVLLVDDHAIVRTGIRMLLSGAANIEIIAEADRGEVACQLYLSNKPDVVVLDLSMPGIGGLECIRRLCSRDPLAKILVFSVHNEAVYINRALAAGAKGYITKSSAPDLLIDAIQTIAANSGYVESDLMDIDIHQENPRDSYQNLVNTLSPKEFDVFCLLTKGLTTHKIADELCISYKTAANYSTQIKNKFNASTITELAHIATALGIIKIED